MRRWMTSQPPWVQGVIGGVFFAAFTGLLSLVQGGDPAGLAVHAVGGIVFGLVMAWLVRRADDRTFAGSSITDAGERADVLLGAWRGPVPDDPEHRAAAARFLELSRTRNRRAMWWACPMFVLIGGASAWWAVTDSPSWWIGVAGMVGVLATFVWTERRTTSRLSLLSAGESDA